MAEWHHRLNGHEFEQALGDSEGQGSLARCSPWGHKESDTTERLNNNTSFKAEARPSASSRAVGLGIVCLCAYGYLSMCVAQEKGFLLSTHHFLIKVKFPFKC